MSNQYIKTSQVESLYSHSMGAFDDEGLTHDAAFLDLFDKKGPNERAMMNVWASAIWAYFKVMEDPKAVPNIVVGGNHQWGRETVKEPLGQLMAEATLKVLSEYHIPGVVTLLKSWTDEDGKERPIMDTSSEVIAHLQHAESKGRKVVGSVSSNTHIASIEKNYDIHTKDSGIQVVTYGADSIIQAAPEPFQKSQYLETVYQVTHSDDEKQFKRRELVKLVILTFLGKYGEQFLREKTQNDLTPGVYATPGDEEFEAPTP